MSQPAVTFVSRTATLWGLALSMLAASGVAWLELRGPAVRGPFGQPGLLALTLGLLLLPAASRRVPTPAMHRAVVVVLALHAIGGHARVWSAGAPVDTAALGLLLVWGMVVTALLFLGLRGRWALAMSAALAVAAAAMPWLAGAATLPLRAALDDGVRMALVGGVMQLLCAGVGFAVARQVAQLTASSIPAAAMPPRRQAWSVSQLVSRREREQRRLLAATERAARLASLKDAELHALWDAFPGLLWRLDARGVVSHANAAAAALLGRPADGVTGRHARELLGEAGWRESQRCSRGASADRAPAGFEVTVERADGSLCELLVTQFVIAAADGDADGAPLTYQMGVDIGARKTAEQALARAKAEAERANREKSRCLSRFSHELRTPLNAVLGLAQLLRPGSDGDAPAVAMAAAAATEQRLHLRTIADAGRELLALVDRTMDLSRLEVGEMRVSCRPVALLELVHSAWETVVPMAQAHGVRLAPPPQPRALWVHADPVRLRQVLLNLLTNAIKYNRPGGGVALRVTQRGAEVRLAVHDTGRGLTAAQQAQLFEPYNRLGAENGPVAGSGIGLSIARGLTTLMGGRLEVVSEPGVGSEFRLWLALAPAPQVVTELAEPPSDFGALREDDNVVGDVLYVEDNDVNVLVLQAVLARRPGVRLRVARDTRQALALVRQPGVAPPALVVLDLNLPDGCGLALAQALRAVPGYGEVPLALLTADATAHTVARAREAGVTRVWHKPFDAGRLLREIDALLQPAAALPCTAG